jgi:transcriptional regulator with XRE-family HTH domain
LQDSLTQSELGSRLGIAKSTISLYESGKREPDFETLEKFADFFNVPMSTFFPDGEEEEKPAALGNELFEKFSKLSAKDQALVRSTMRLMIEQLLNAQSEQ